MLMPASTMASHKNAPSAVLLIRGGRIASAMLEAEFSKLGLTVPYAAILTALLEHGSKTATDLCMLTMRERANMSVLLGKLRKIQYIAEESNPLDARSHMIVLTEQGQQMAERCKAMTDDVSLVIDRFLEGHDEAPAKFKLILTDLIGKFHSLYA